MKISGLTLDEFTKIVKRVSDEVYDGNVIVEPSSQDTGSNRCTARIKAVDGRGTGSRRDVNGRRMSAACWHAYRDVIHGIVEAHPEAKIDTGMEKYHGMAEFLRRYPSTADRNIGNGVRPVYMPDLCECGSAIAWPSW